MHRGDSFRCAPEAGSVSKAISALWNEMIAPCGMPPRTAWVSPLRSRCGRSASPPDPTGTRNRDERPSVCHVPYWQLVAPYSNAGEVTGALVWLTPGEIDDDLNTALPELAPGEFDEPARARALMPTRMAEAVSAHLPHD